VRGFDSHDAFAIDAVQIRPFPVPHDAREPVQFVCSDGRWRLGVLTDLGVSTGHVEACLSGCDALVLECNHDLDLLAGGDYPYPLKQRIAGKYGHLDNAAAAALLARLDTSRLQHLFAAHLSAQNNRRELAGAALAGALNCAPDWVGIADQQEGFDWREFI
jgi:phosphoribosyl 1,2-cyclic phosphodiesterase